MKSVLVMGLVMALGLSAAAQVPLQFTYQGRLTDSNGVPVVAEQAGVVFQIVKGGVGISKTGR